MVELGQSGHGALAASAAGALLDGDGGRHPQDGVHVRPRRRLHELAGVGVERFEIAALPLREQDVEGDRALAAATDAGDDGEAVAGDLHVDVLEVVLARPVHRYRVVPTAAAIGGGALGNPRTRLRRAPPPPPGRRRCGCGRSAPAPSACRRRRGGLLPPRPLDPRSTTQSAARTTSRLCSMDDQRVAFVDQAAQRAEERGDVVEVKPGGGLVEEKEGARFARRARLSGTWRGGRRA